ncbi:TonB-dependent receptor [Nitratireductor aquibiodomus]|uniref:TonB-dependent receptor n=1 Tax=Nitratireductor aquibiodomus TaxID=204799 RepID=UPI000688C00A|nr:TonB-dependent receptor [Nitratireductor aquibiodomus]
MAVAQEQNGYAETTTLPAITVTGQKMDRSLQDTAVSVSVVTADDIEQKPDAGTVADMLQGIPNVLFTNNVDAPIIRGIDTKGPIVKGNAYLAKPIPRATISVDGRYLNPSELDYGAASMWDVDSIEVFRGPQTTTQGAHSMAGAVIVNTKDPTFTQELAGQVLYGSYEKKRVSFMANGPIMQDLAARFAFDYSGRETFIDYTNPAFTARDMDQDFRDINARMKLLWEPGEIPGLQAKLTYSRTQIKRPSDEAATYPYDNLENETVYVDSVRTRTDTGIFDLKYDFGNDVVLRNQLQYSDGTYDFTFAEPFSGLASRDYENLSNEFRVNFGNEDSVWSGVAGIYYSNDRAHNKFNNVLGSADADLTHQSVGIFSEVNWRLAERWALTGGLRYQNDRIGHDGVSSYVPGVRHDYEKTFDAILPSISLAYDVTDDFTVGGLISRGYLPGGTGVNFHGGEYYTFDEETAWNYELFARANLLDNRLSITGNLFYTRYKGSQRSVTDYLPDGRPFGSIIINADRADAYGLELSADYQVLDNLRLRGGLGLLRTDITRFADYRGNAFEGKEFAKLRDTCSMWAPTGT